MRNNKSPQKSLV